ncbi:DUF4012 domain-containing protein [Microbacterium esteraromaticum]|uniref:DUF4012 domain-containing protein n=1 Tax=Microbacterium esteraromaticum TaxID=57043 RepID=UPI00195837AA|nr:DUF4012 domain-containing protein [Microbacterium esteraromaticum]MBM7466743.1 hypothetical protein [Microbacterium esteraromaticum]
MQTRAERRAQQQREQTEAFDQFSREIFDTDAGSGDDGRPPRRPLLRSFRFWVPISILLILIAVVVIGGLMGKHVYDRAMAAKSSLEQAMPLASKAADDVMAGDNAAAKETVAQISALTADARKQTDDDIWKSLEWVPVAGPNLYAVRTAASVTDDLVRDALTPATDLSLAALKPADGAIDLAGIKSMQGVVSQASTAVSKAATQLDTIQEDELISQVSGALGKLTGTVDELEPMLKPAAEILGVLPAALGDEKPRNYLVLIQNNAESRGTGGNPAALVVIKVDKGRISIEQQASSGDFDNGRKTPVTKLNPETVGLYGDKIGRWMQDSTLSPDFTETAGIMRAWWAEEFGTPIDAVVSFDPVALGYLLKATGPVTVPNDPVDVGFGYKVRVMDEPLTLTDKNAVPFLLNGIYSEYPVPERQDAVFAASAQAVFTGLTSGKAEPKALLAALTQATDEGRLMYQPATESEAELVGESRLAGKLPTTNDSSTMVGAYVNDITEGKLDYYMQLDLAASSTQCTAPDAPVFGVTATLTNTLNADQAAGLARYIAPARFFKKGDVATNLVLYGPIGAKTATVTVDGKPAKATLKPHLGRPAVLVQVQNAPGQKHTVSATFDGAAGEYGPLEVRHTPMVRPTALTVDAAGCGD